MRIIVEEAKVLASMNFIGRVVTIKIHVGIKHCHPLQKPVGKIIR